MLVAGSARHFHSGQRCSISVNRRTAAVSTRVRVCDVVRVRLAGCNRERRRLVPRAIYRRHNYLSWARAFNYSPRSGNYKSAANAQSGTNGLLPPDSHRARLLFRFRSLRPDNPRSRRDKNRGDRRETNFTERFLRGDPRAPEHLPKGIFASELTENHVKGTA